MQILIIRKGFEAFECNFNNSKGTEAFDSKFKPFEMDSNLSNPISKHSKGIRGIRMQIQTIRMGFGAFECIQVQKWTIRNGLEGFEIKFEPFECDSKFSNANSNHSKVIRSFRMQIRTIQKGF